MRFSNPGALSCGEDYGNGVFEGRAGQGADKGFDVGRCTGAGWRMLEGYLVRQVCVIESEKVSG